MKRISKKFLAYAVTAAMILPTVSFAQITPEIQSHWAKDTISKWLDRGYIKGDQNGKVNPNKTITRAEFITMVNKAFSYTGEASNPFKDVKKGNWFYDQVIIALANDYIKGISDTEFAPNGIITREQAAVIIAKIKKLPKTTEELKFTDKNSISSWAVEAVKSMVASGIMAGFPDNTVKPLNKLSRAEAIILLDKALQYDAATGKTEKEEKPAPGTQASEVEKFNVPTKKLEVKNTSKLTYLEKQDLNKALLKANPDKHIKEFVIDDKGNVTEVIFDDGSVIKNPKDLNASALVKEQSAGGGGGGGGGGGSYGNYDGIPSTGGNTIVNPTKDELDALYTVDVSVGRSGEAPLASRTIDNNGGGRVGKTPLIEIVNAYVDETEKNENHKSNAANTIVEKFNKLAEEKPITVSSKGTKDRKDIMLNSKADWDKVVNNSNFPTRDGLKIPTAFDKDDKFVGVKVNDIDSYVQTYIQKKTFNDLIEDIAKAKNKDNGSAYTFVNWESNIPGFKSNFTKEQLSKKLGDLTLADLYKVSNDGKEKVLTLTRPVGESGNQTQSYYIKFTIKKLNK